MPALLSAVRWHLHPLMVVPHVVFQLLFPGQSFGHLPGVRLRVCHPHEHRKHQHVKEHRVGEDHQPSHLVGHHEADHPQDQLLSNVQVAVSVNSMHDSINDSSSEKETLIPN